MPRPNDSPDVKASKALAYILRHGAEKEGLDMRQDGYLKLNDVVSTSQIERSSPTGIRPYYQLSFRREWKSHNASKRPRLR